MSADPNSPLRRARPTPRPGIAGIAAYVGGQSAIPGVAKVVRLASNEGAFGPNPRAVEAYRAAAPELHRYPDGNSTALREALARRHGLEPERILCGNGSDDLITLLIRAYAGPGDEVLYNRHGFLVYPIVARSVGATPVTAAETRLTIDVDRMLAAVTPKTRVVIFANPNNPTGTYLTHDALSRLHAGLPPDVLLVIDAAYGEFVTAEDYEPGIALVRAAENVVMTRTFSKIYALGGLRLGWAYCPAAIAETIDRIRDAFNVNRAAQAAGLAALEDDAFVEKCRAHNARWRTWLGEELAAMGLEPVPSQANFLLVRFPDEPGRDAAAAWDHLRARHILTRKVRAYGLPEYLRITIGLEDEMRAVVAALREFLPT